MNKILLSIFAGLVLFLFSCSNDDSEETLPKDDEGEVVIEGERIRVMAYNIHHANPPSKPGVIDIDAIVRVIENQDPDIVALQEVDVNTERSGPDLNQAEAIATALDMNYYFGKAIDYEGGEYGVAILSKYPMSEERVYKLPSTGEQRVLATAKITLKNGEEIRFGSTHLDASSSTNRQLQIEEIGEIASEEELPFIIAGDFNATPGSEVIETLDYYFDRTCRFCPPTIPVKDPTRAIDFIAYKHPEGRFSVEKQSHKVINETYASDHRPVFAIIILEDE